MKKLFLPFMQKQKNFLAFMQKTKKPGATETNLIA